MSLLSLIVALLLEQWQPLAAHKTLHAWLARYVNFFEHYFSAGKHKNGRIAWLLALLFPLSATAVLYWLLYSTQPVLAWIFTVLVLYLTMGFRHFSHYYTDIHQALHNNDLDKARSLLASWRGMSCHELNAEEVARVTIEKALLASHRHVFGVIAWFVFTMLLGLGPAGAVLYRLAQFLNNRWNGARWGKQDDDEFGLFARQAYHWMEWLPLRLTAFTFAIVGDFEDTVYCWRTQAQSWPDPDAGIILASGAGALGVRLGQPIPQDGLPLDRPELGIGDEADVDFMQSAVGLVWRALVFWLILLLLLGLASLAGS